MSILSDMQEKLKKQNQSSLPFANRSYLDYLQERARTGSTALAPPSIFPKFSAPALDGKSRVLNMPAPSPAASKSRTVASAAPGASGRDGSLSLRDKADEWKEIYANRTSSPSDVSSLQVGKPKPGTPGLNAPALRKTDELPPMANALKPSLKTTAERLLEMKRSDGGGLSKKTTAAQEASGKDGLNSAVNSGAKRAGANMSEDDRYYASQKRELDKYQSARGARDYMDAVGLAENGDIKTGLFMSRGEAITKYLTDDKFRATQNISALTGSGQSQYSLLGLLTDDERWDLLYLAGKNEYENVDKYYKLLEPALQERLYNESSRQIENAPAALTAILPVAAAPAAGGAFVENAGQWAKNKLTGKYEPVNLNAGAIGLKRLSNLAKDKTLEKVPEALKPLANIGYGVAETLVGSGGSPAGMIAAGARNYASDSTVRALERGASPGQAFASGAITGGLTMLGGSAMKAATPVLSTGSIGAQALKFGALGAGAGLAYSYADVLADRAVMGEKSNYELTVKRLMEQGLSEDEARKQANVMFYLEQPTQSAALGGVVGGAAGLWGARNTLRSGSAPSAGGELALTQPSQTLNSQNTLALQSGLGGMSVKPDNMSMAGIVPASSRVQYSVDGKAQQDMAETISEYQSAVDPELVRFVDKIQHTSNPDEINKARYSMGRVSERTAGGVQRLTGIDVSEYESVMPGEAVRHITRRHGPEGQADSSMADIGDIARAKYVLDNFDTVEVMTERDTANLNKDRTPSLLLKFSKRINGNYILVEALPDTKAKKMQVKSTYIENTKNRYSRIPDAEAPSRTSNNAYGNPVFQETENRMPDAQSPSHTSDNAYGNSASNNIIPPTAQKVNGREASPELERAVALGRSLGREVEIADLPAGQNGVFKDGKIYISKNSAAPVMATLAHELTHSIEGSSYYAKLSSLVTGKNGLGATLERSGMTLDDIVRAVRGEYSQVGVQITAEDAQKELVARFVQDKLLTDEAAIKNLVKTDQNVAQRVLDWIRGAMVRLTGTPERRMLARANNLYVKALNDAVGNPAPTLETPRGGESLSLTREGVENESLEQFISRMAEKQKAERSPGLQHGGDAKAVEAREKFEGTPALRKLGVKIENSVGDYYGVRSLVENERAARSVREATRKAERRLKASAEEKSFAAGIAAGVYTEKDVPKTMDSGKVMGLSDYYRAERSSDADGIRQRRADINRKLDGRMGELFKDSGSFKPSGILRLNYGAPERKIFRIFGEERGRAINEELFWPVDANEAERFRFKNRMYDDVRRFADSTGKRSALTKNERAVVQQVIEGRAAEETVAGMEMAEAIKAAAENIKNGSDLSDSAREFSLGSEERKLAERYSRWLQTKDVLESGKIDSVKVENAVKKYSEMFDLFYDAINDFLAAHGYEPIGYIKGYAPHLQPDSTLDAFSKALQSMGLNTDVTKLPTNIAGLTANYKPNKRWNPYFLQRMGDATKYDIAAAYESYVDYMSDVLYHTDDIMRVRAAAKYFRRTYASDEIREMLSWAEELRYGDVEGKTDFLRDAGVISKTSMLSDEDVNKTMDNYIEEQYESIKKTKKYSDFVMWLDNYANVLSGKQSTADRGSESHAGRPFLNVGNKLVRAFARSNVAGNLSSALNQTAQIPLILGENGVKYTSLAVKDIISGQALRKTGWAQESDFLTGKRGVDFLVTDTADMIVGTMLKPIEFMDSLVSTVAVRGRYLKEVAAGKSHKDAMRAADAYGRSVMGSRMKGSKPAAFAAKGPVYNMLHMFQIESFNVWEHVVEDLPRDFKIIAREKGKAAAAWALAGVLVKMLLAAFLLNRVTEEISGGTPAPFDILGLTSNFIASGQGLSTNEYLAKIVDNGFNKVTGERLLGTDELARDEPFDWGAAISDTASNISNDIPFLRNASALLGWGDETLPLPDLWGTGSDIKKAVERKGLFSAETGKAVFKGASQFVPGGRQISKTVLGVEALVRGGDYTVDAQGRDILKYQVERNVGTAAQSVFFGKTATTGGRKWVENNFKNYNASETAAYQELIKAGAISREVISALDTMKKLDKSADKREALTKALLTDAQRAVIYKNVLADNSALESGKPNERQKFEAFADEGMDTGTLYRVFSGFKDAENPAGKRAVLRGSALTDEQKAKVYLDMLADDSKTESGKLNERQKLEHMLNAGADAGELYKVFDGMKKCSKDNERRTVLLNSKLTERQKRTAYALLVSEDHEEKIQTLTKSGVSFERFMRIYNKYSDINSKDLTPKEKATEFARYLDSLKLTENQWDAAFDQFKYMQMNPATPQGYRLDLMSERARERFPQAQKTGYTEAEYVELYPLYHGTDADGKQKKKDDIIADAMAWGLSRRKAEELWTIIRGQEKQTSGKPTLNKPTLSGLSLERPTLEKRTLPGK